MTTLKKSRTINGDEAFLQYGSEDEVNHAQAKKKEHLGQSL